MKSIAARAIQASASALFLAFFGVSALAQAPSASGYPTKPIRLVVPFTPGGSTDVLARAIGQELTKAWGQSVVVENVPVAGGAIGADKVAKAAPDGYTLLMGHIGTLAVNPSLYPRLPYNPVKDFAPVAWVARVPNVLVVHPSVAARNVKELVALAKSRSGQLNYGSGGNGSAANLATEFLKLQTGTSLVHIPYRGTAPAVTDLMAGQIQLMFTGLPALVAPLKGGQLRALAVSSPQRLQALPGVRETVSIDHIKRGFQLRCGHFAHAQDFVQHDAAFVVVAFDDMVVGLRVHRQLVNGKWGQTSVGSVPVA